LLIANEALFNTVQEHLRGSGIQVREDSRAINDKDFPRDIAKASMVKTREHEAD
jgi:hypothetical protein